MGEPWNRAKYHDKWAGATLNHQFTSNWNIRNGFRATFFNWDFYDVYPNSLLPDNRTLTRGIEDANYPRRFYDNQTDVTGTFTTGPVRHTLLFGFEAGTQGIRQHALGGYDDAPSIDIFTPVFASLTRPPHSTFINSNNPTTFHGMCNSDSLHSAAMHKTRFSSASSRSMAQCVLRPIGSALTISSRERP